MSKDYLNKMLNEEDKSIDESSNKWEYLKEKDMVVVFAPHKSNGEIKDKIESLLGLNREDKGPNKGDHGYYLGELCNMYEITSVNPNFYVGSIRSLSPSETRPLARKLMKRLNESVLNEEDKPIDESFEQWKCANCGRASLEIGTFQHDGETTCPSCGSHIVKKFIRESTSDEYKELNEDALFVKDINTIYNNVKSFLDSSKKKGTKITERVIKSLLDPYKSIGYHEKTDLLYRSMGLYCNIN